MTKGMPWTATVLSRETSDGEDKLESIVQEAEHCYCHVASVGG